MVVVDASAAAVLPPDHQAAGDEAEELFLIRFLMVEFQKFLISLSVRPGSRAAIWDHLECRNAGLVDFTVKQTVEMFLSEKKSRVHLHIFVRVNKCQLHAAS